MPDAGKSSHKKKRIIVRQKGSSDHGDTEKDSLIEHSDNDSSSDGGLLNSRGTRSVTSSSSGYQKVSHLTLI